LFKIWHFLDPVGSKSIREEERKTKNQIQVPITRFLRELSYLLHRDWEEIGAQRGQRAAQVHTAALVDSVPPSLSPDPLWREKRERVRCDCGSRDSGSKPSGRLSVLGLECLQS
jgi:hypothetical protein